jgi:hypothetical protein
MLLQLRLQLGALQDMFIIGAGGKSGLLCAYEARNRVGVTGKVIGLVHGEAGKKRLAGDTARAATSDEVRSMRGQTQALKEAVADLTLENRLLKKSMIGDGDERG